MHGLRTTYDYDGGLVTARLRVLAADGVVARNTKPVSLPQRRLGSVINRGRQVPAGKL